MPVIEYLESDNYKASKKDIFYYGYLRGYAKILNLPAVELVESYRAAIGNNQLPVNYIHEEKSDNLSRVSSAVSNYVGWFTCVFVIVLISGIGIWWNTKYKFQENESSYSITDVSVVNSTN